MSARVYKLGGAAVEDAGLVTGLAAELRRVGGEAVLVHGGGSRVTELLDRLGIESRFVGGRRATSPAAMEVVEMVLSGLTNKALVAALIAAGVPALGLSGRDASLIGARLEPELGKVGRPEAIDPAVLRAAWRGGWVPVVSPIASGPDCEAVNVNADEAALGVARALRASSLVYLSDVDGVRIGDELVAELDRESAQAAIEAGQIRLGMRLKVDVALEASRAGIPEVVVAGGARFEGGFAGTRIVAERAA